MKTKEELRELIAFLDAHLVAIDKGSESRSLDADEQIRFDEGLAARTEAKTQLDQIEAREAEVAELARTAPAAVIDGDGNKGAPNMIVRNDPFDMSEVRWNAPVGEVRSKALAAIEQVEGLTDAHREQAEHVLRSVDTRDGRIAKHMLATGAPAYRSAFLKLAAGDGALLSEAERSAVELSRAASLTDANGGYAVPFTLDPTIIDTGSHSTNPFRQISRVVQITTDAWNGVSSAGVTASWDAEGAEVSDDAPTLAQPTIPVYKGQAFVPFSVEIGGDWPNIEADVRMMIANAKDDLEGAAFATGTGSAQPTGITKALDGTTSEIAPTTAETFALADVYKLEGTLQARYRANASWVANKVVYNTIRQFDTTGGSALWERIGAGMPSQLLGYNAYESSNMDGVLPDAAATADNFLAVIGDFSNYVIVDRVGLSIELVPHLFHTSNNRPSGQRGFLAWWRVGADSVNDAAFAMLSVPTAA
jgi:HK97 family phage major capsid protein